LNTLEPERLARLAHALRTSPRHVLVAAARLARMHEQGTADPAQRRAIVRETGSPAAERTAALLLTPIASFAQDDTDRALASLWPADS